MDDFRYWLARKLLSFVNRLDPETKIMCNAREQWHFRRGWKQPKSETDFEQAA